MKTRIQKLALAIIIASGVNAVASEKAPEPRDVAVGVNDVYIPGGLNYDSDVAIVVSGIFPNGCYRWKGAQVTNLSATTHQIQAVASVSQGMCIMVLVPFSKEIKLGRLQTGVHTVRFLNGDGTYHERSFKVQ